MGWASRTSPRLRAREVLAQSDSVYARRDGAEPESSGGDDVDLEPVEVSDDRDRSPYERQGGGIVCGPPACRPGGHTRTGVGELK
jgi:hypothetical protein